MCYSVDDAKKVIYDAVLHRSDGARLEDTPAIFDEFTIEKQWGWIFFYNNERYRLTRDTKSQWVGPGPIFFNRETGDIRRFGSGCNLDDEIYDYEMELAARGGSWCLWLTPDQDRKQTIVKLKRALGITTTDAMAMVPVLPHCLFAGIRRHLDRISRQLAGYGIATRITLECSTECAQSIFTYPEWMINPSLAQAYHERWDVVT